MLICLTDWISDSVYHAMRCFRDDVLKDFVFSKQAELSKSWRHLKAVRSFVVAHPLDTYKHERYDLDGDLICLVIQPYSEIPMPYGEDNRRLSFGGVFNTDSLKYCDYDVKAYSKNDGAAFFCYIGFSLRDLHDVAMLYIEMLC